MKKFSDMAWYVHIRKFYISINGWYSFDRSGYENCLYQDISG